MEFQSFGVAIALFSLIDPANPDVHYITTAEGIRRSVDGRLLAGGVGIQRLDP